MEGRETYKYSTFVKFAKTSGMEPVNLFAESELMRDQWT